ncbi:MAG: hypothetical protein DI563_30120, partial [Variovorax paradoxus]
SYTYTLDNGNAAVNALKDGDTLTEVVGYTITDADGDTSTSTLTITIQGHTDAGSGPGLVVVDGNGSAAGQAEVDERGLVDGPAGPDTSERTTGSIQLSTPDGLRSVTVGGTVVTLAQLQGLGTTPVVIDTPAGTLVLTGFTASTSVGGVPTAGELRYAYVLDGPQQQPGASESLEVIALAVTDAGGASTPGSLAIRIIDDAPTALDDAIDITEDAAPGFVSGNLRDNDRLGADQANGVPVTGLLIDGVPVAPGSVATLAYGTLVVQPDGRYTYTLDNTNPAVQRLIVGETLVERIGYSLTDADGDTSSATLTVTIRGANDGAFLNLVDGNGADALGQSTVHEAGLDTRDGSQATTGQMVVAAPDGLDSIQVGDALLDTARLQALASQPLSITTSRGVLTLTGFDAATGTLRYSYVLGAAQDHRAGPVTDDVQVVVRDRDGDAASGVLRVLVVDDVPTARDDSVTVGTARPDPTAVDGNVFGPTGAGRGDVTDRLGSDATATPVTGIAFDGTAGMVGGPALAGRYGSLVMRPDGSYTYTVDTRNARVLALGSGQTLTEVFVYTLTDADGSTSQARLTITIQGASQWNPPTIDPVRPAAGGSRIARARPVVRRPCCHPCGRRRRRAWPRGSARRTRAARLRPVECGVRRSRRRGLLAFARARCSPRAGPAGAAPADAGGCGEPVPGLRTDRRRAPRCGAAGRARCDGRRSGGRAHGACRRQRPRPARCAGAPARGTARRPAAGGRRRRALVLATHLHPGRRARHRARHGPSARTHPRAGPAAGLRPAHGPRPESLP